MTWLSALVLTVTLGLAARGARVPSAASLFFAGLPWVVGVAGVRLSTSNVLDAVMNVDPAMRAMLIAKGLAEASGARRGAARHLPFRPGKPALNRDLLASRA